MRRVGMSRSAPLVLAFVMILGGFVVFTPDTVDATPLPSIGINGRYLTMGGTNIPPTWVGVDDTEAWAGAVKAHCEGETAYWGSNVNFPEFGGDFINVDNLTEFWSSYFWFCDHYGIEWVRFSNANTWASAVQDAAYTHHNAAYWEVIDEMLHQATEYGIYVTLNPAGGNIDGGATFYSYHGTGEVYNHTHTAGTSYKMYLDFVTAIIAHCDASPYSSAIFTYDMFNEPDCDALYAAYWHPLYVTQAAAQAAFFVWAWELSKDTVGLSSHIVEMGVACGGTFGGYTQAQFNIFTGNVGFDTCHIHRYFSTEDNASVHNPQHWANDTGKPLIVGEVANNANYPVEVWPWYLTQSIVHGTPAIAWMDLVNMTGYPEVVNLSAVVPDINEGDTLSVTPTINIGPGVWSLTTDSGATINPSTGLITWTTDDGDDGTYSLDVAFANYVQNNVNVLVNFTVNDSILPVVPGIIASDFSSGTAPLVIAFNVTVTGGTGVYDFLWDFDDGTSSVLEDPTHTFAVAGVYHVTLTVNGTIAPNTLTMTVSGGGGGGTGGGGGGGATVPGTTQGGLTIDSTSLMLIVLGATIYISAIAGERKRRR